MDLIEFECKLEDHLRKAVTESLPSWKTKVLSVEQIKETNCLKQLQFLICATTYEDVQTWIRAYENHTFSTYRIRNSVKGSGKIIIVKKVLNCHHNSNYISKVTNVRSRRKTKYTSCPSTMTVKLYSVNQIKNSDENMFCEIKLRPTHNHNIKTAEILKYRPVDDKVREKIYKLFQNGYTPISAMEYIKMDVTLGCKEPEFLLIDRKFCPDYNYYLHLYQTFKKNNSVDTNTQESNNVNPICSENENGNLFKGGEYNFTPNVDTLCVKSANCISSEEKHSAGSLNNTKYPIKETDCSFTTDIIQRNAVNIETSTTLGNKSSLQERDEWDSIGKIDTKHSSAININRANSEIIRKKVECLVYTSEQNVSEFGKPSSIRKEAMQIPRKHNSDSFVMTRKNIKMNSHRNYKCQSFQKAKSKKYGKLLLEQILNKLSVCLAKYSNESVTNLELFCSKISKIKTKLAYNPTLRNCSTDLGVMGSSIRHRKENSNREPNITSSDDNMISFIHNYCKIE